jgi:hypothetical protein
MDTMAHPTIADVDYTAPDRARSNRIHRPLIIATHALHLVSSVIVLSMVAYLLSEFDRDINVEHPNYGRHLLYWLLVVRISRAMYDHVKKRTDIHHRPPSAPSSPSPRLRSLLSRPTKVTLPL